jgi:DNA-3-methyladenine glycosylase II
MMLSAIDELAARDDVLAVIIESTKIEVPQPHQDYFGSLVKHIVSQQLSVRAAATIHARLETLVDGEVQPESILRLRNEDLRTAGLSGRKVRYVNSLATSFINSPSLFESLDSLQDEQIIDELIQINGIGRWTGEMFLIFTLGRLDVFAVDDLGLRRAIERYYHVPPNSPKSTYLAIAEVWRPHRSIASLYLWASLDNTATKKSF